MNTTTLHDRIAESAKHVTSMVEGVRESVRRRTKLETQSALAMVVREGLSTVDDLATVADQARKDQLVAKAEVLRAMVLCIRQQAEDLVVEAEDMGVYLELGEHLDDAVQDLRHVADYLNLPNEVTT